MSAILAVFPMNYFCRQKGYRENFLSKTEYKRLFPFILCAFDFHGKYMRLFISEYLLSANARRFTILKHYFDGLTRAYSRHWGHGTFFGAHFSKKRHFACLHTLSRCYFQPFLIKIFFQNSGHQIQYDSRTQQRSRIGPAEMYFFVCFCKI